MNEQKTGLSADRAEAAAHHWRAMDIAFQGRAREHWNEYSREQRDEWWIMDKGGDSISDALWSSDKPYHG